MKEAIGNIWFLLAKGYKIGVPCNIGWMPNGLAIMGVGVAKQAAYRYPDLLPWWGNICKTRKVMTPVSVHPKHPIICIPVKPLDEKHPSLSWKQPADSWLIEGSLMELRELPGDYPIAIPYLGCGAGGLDEKHMLRVFKLYLKDYDRFTLVKYGTPSVKQGSPTVGAK